jgi:uncharacterized alpha-E superfamily protein
VLSRTADSLYWLSRYIERADYLARSIEAAQRLSSLPAAYAGEANEWESAVETAGSGEIFHEKYEAATAETVAHFLICSPDNPSSILKCFESARTNARAVRTALTTEMWDAINGAWLELRNYAGKDLNRDEFGRFLDWVKTVSLTFDGSAFRTMLRNDAFWFTRLGTAIERADNTARILDVKYQILLPHDETVGGSLDYFQWTTILREVSAFNAYHWVYRESVKPLLVADLLMLNKQMPRSFANCYGVIVEYLDLIADAYGRRGPSQRLAGNMLAKLEGEDINRVFASGLHEFVEAFIAENNRVGEAIAKQYLVG